MSSHLHGSGRCFLNRGSQSLILLRVLQMLKSFWPPLKHRLCMGSPALFLIIFLSVTTACTKIERTPNELSPRPASHELVSKDTRYLEKGRAVVFVYKIPVGGTLCSDNGWGNCKYWDSFEAQFDVKLHPSAANTRVAKEKAIEAFRIHCRGIRRTAKPSITEVTVDFVRFENGCHRKPGV